MTDTPRGILSFNHFGHKKDIYCGHFLQSCLGQGMLFRRSYFLLATQMTYGFKGALVSFRLTLLAGGVQITVGYINPAVGRGREDWH